MATNPIAASTQPQQPDLRPFIVYGRVPAGCSTYPVPDASNEPHLSCGEWVIADPADREPETGELFVLQWATSSAPRIVTMRWIDQLGCWEVRGTKAAFDRTPDGVRLVQRSCIGDFGFTTEYLRGAIKGRVIGILEPTFAERLNISQERLA